MPNEITPPPGVATAHVQGGEAPPIVQPNLDPPDDGDDGDEAASVSPSGGTSRVAYIPQAAMKKLKEAERAKGKKDAQAEMETAAKAAGFSSFADALASIRPGASGQQPQRRAAPAGEIVDPGAPPTPPKRSADHRAWERYERARKQWETDRMQYRDQLAKEKNRRRALEREIQAKDAEMALRETAVLCGVTEVDYAVRLLTKQLEGKSEEELAGFDEQKFFKDLRTTKPFLFGQVQVPATTGTAGQAPNGSPAPAAPTNVAPAAAASAQVDARKMSREEFAARLAKMGLNTPSL